jgi:hypothetical protein
MSKKDGRLTHATGTFHHVLIHHSHGIRVECTTATTTHTHHVSTHVTSSIVEPVSTTLSSTGSVKVLDQVT